MSEPLTDARLAEIRADMRKGIISSPRIDELAEAAARAIAAEAKLETAEAALAEAERQLSEYLQSPQGFIRTLQKRALAAEAENATLRGDKISLQVALEKSDELRVAAEAQLETARRKLTLLAIITREQLAEGGNFVKVGTLCRLCGREADGVAQIIHEPNCALQPQQKERCHADRDGDCNWSGCPQLKARQSHCPLDKSKEQSDGG